MSEGQGGAMVTTSISVEAQVITGAPGLDTIHVYWANVGMGNGYLTITCYGSAWTAYFGSTGERSIQQFFAGCDTEYMVTKMGITPHLKATKRDHAYLAKIIEAVKSSLKVSA